MNVYIDRDDLRQVLDGVLSQNAGAAVSRPVLVGNCDQRDVFHVYPSAPGPKVSGQPEVGWLICLPEASGGLVPLPTDERERWIEAALPEAALQGGPALCLVAAPTADPARPAVGSFLYTPGQHSLQEVETRFLSDRNDLFSRSRAILPAEALAGKTVSIIGVGSGGSMAALELAKSGLPEFHLVDMDRLELPNIVRHACGLADLGRYKTRAVRDLILDRNPGCRVHCHEVDIEAEPGVQEEVVAAADVVLAATDSPSSRRLINRACLRQRKVGIFAGMVARTYAGDLLRVRPGESACYECAHFLWTRHQAPELPDPADAGALYGHELPVPGLSTDILPVVIHSVKVALLELVRGTDFEPAGLAADLQASLYVWANRREGEYGALRPMGYAIDGLTTNRWYGIRLPPVPDCPGCGGAAPGD